MWSLFIIIFVALSGSAHFYVWLKMRAALVPGAWRAAFIFIGVLGNVAILSGRSLRGMLPESMVRWAGIVDTLSIVWLVLVLLSCLCLILVEILALIIGRRTPAGVLTFGLGLGFALFLWGIGGAYFVQRRDVTIPNAKLPDNLERLRLVQLSDIHLGGLYTRSHLERALAIVREAKPDLILMTGDLVDGDTHLRERERDMLREVASAAPLGAFAINGNHEGYTRWMFGTNPDIFIAGCGFQLLVDQRIEIPQANLVIIGFADGEVARFDSLVQPEDRDKFVLVLKHRPRPPLDADGQFDLQLSGHTHGGQIWPLGYVASRANGNSVQGLTERAGGLIYTSNGTGFWGPPLRIGATPEVTVIDLVRDTAAIATEEN